MVGDIPMRRFENQVHDREMIRAILDNILIVNLGINDGDYPYVVPLSFGYEMTEEQLLIYLHCAREGHKADLWRKNPKVSLTFSTLTNHPNNLYKGAMHDFRSIMANGIIRQVPRNKSGGQHGRAVQAILRHNGRRPNQFSVPHYMFMDVYVVECDWKHVSAKSEEPMKHVKEVPFPTMEEIQECTEEAYDYSYFFSRKVYQESSDAKEHIPCAQGLTELAEPTALPLKNGDEELKLGFRWDTYEEGTLDCDVLAVVLDKEGKIPRRYDIAFYNQKTDRSKSIRHLGDDILTTKGEEYLSVNFKEIPGRCYGGVYAVKYQFNYGKDLLVISQREKISISEIMLRNEMEKSERSREEILGEMHSNLIVMRESIERGLDASEKHHGLFTGGDAVKLMSFAEQSSMGTDMAAVVASAMAVVEFNAAMGKIVAAPTAGASGILPAVLIVGGETKGFDDEKICRGLFTAGAIGCIIAKNACIAGASGGCQAETGSAAAMAAGALAELRGADVPAVLDAAAIALKNIMGLVCDPVGGFVECPCVKRNAIGAANAVLSCDLALAGIKSLIPFDEVVTAMKWVGCQMHSDLKETARGGLAATPTAQKLSQKLM